MPQHPQYANTPEKNLEKLYKLLDELEKFGMMHEERHQSFEALMSELYPDATHAYAVAERGDSEDDNDESNEYDDIFTPTVSALFEFVTGDEREQFIQDFRNVIAHCLFSNTYDIEGVADEISQMRDIEYYRNHVYLEEDTETINKYQHEGRTVWFPYDILPNKEGIYEVSNEGYENPKHSGFAYWDGSKWHKSFVLLKDCINQQRSKNTESWRNHCWRGFLNQIS